MGCAGWVVAGMSMVSRWQQACERIQLNVDRVGIMAVTRGG